LRRKSLIIFRDDPRARTFTGHDGAKDKAMVIHATNLLRATALLSVLALAACENQGPNQAGGTAIGAATGGLLGAAIAGPHDAFAGLVFGAVAGGLIGNAIGKDLDDADRARMREAQERAYRAHMGEAVVWDNPNSGHSGSITPIRDGHTESGAYCREFQTVVTVGGQKQSAYGKACQQPDGSWKIVS
jgi:surface antigen